MENLMPCTCTIANPCFVEELILNYDALPPSLRGWRRFRIEYGFECGCPEGLIYLPPYLDEFVIEDLLRAVVQPTS